MRLVSSLTGLGLFGAGLTVSIIASFVAALGIHAVTSRVSGTRAGLAAAGLFAVWPGSGTEWSGYSESSTSPSPHGPVTPSCAATGSPRAS